MKNGFSVFIATSHQARSKGKLEMFVSGFTCQQIAPNTSHWKSSKHEHWANHCCNISGGLQTGIADTLKSKRHHKGQLSICNLCSNNTINIIYSLYGLIVGWRRLLLNWRRVEWLNRLVRYSITEHFIVINQYTFWVTIPKKTCLPQAASTAN